MLKRPELIKLSLVIALLAMVLLIALWLQENQKETALDDSDCRLENSACSVQLEGGNLEVEILSRPIPLEEQVTIDFQLPSGAELLKAHIEGINMYMGRIPVLLERLDAQTVRGQTFLGSCSEPSMKWRLILVLQVPSQAQPVTRQFQFSTSIRPV